MWKNVQRIMGEREKLATELEMLGARVFHSSTNFLLFRSEIPALAEELEDRGIFVMDASAQLGTGFARLTVGKPEENDEFIRTYRAIKHQTAGREIRYE
jgi:histidinol-phosphate/aromatic aminotransferase/cobyric acid decarboxylase-like protein